MKKMAVRDLVLLAILGGWALVFRMIEVPLLPAAPFLKMDFSDFVVLIATLAYGPWGLIAVAGIRDVIWYLFTGGDMGIPIGEIMSLTASIVMFLPTYFVLKNGRQWPSMVQNSLMGLGLIVNLTVAMSLLNYFFALPFYTSIMNFPINDFFGYIIEIILPFNLIKGAVYAIGQGVIITVITPVLIKKNTYFLR